MQMIEIKNRLTLSVISHEMVADLLKKSVSNINDKISNLVKNNELVHLKKGFYSYSKAYLTQPIDLISVANALYTPSYIFFDYALSYYEIVKDEIDISQMI